MTALGADPGALDDLAGKLDALATDIEHRRARLWVWIEADRFWKGPAATEFRHAWEHQYSRQLSDAVGYLHGTVKTLHDNANQQRVASGESPRDYGSSVSTFTHGLFGGIKHLGREALHQAEHVGDRAVHSVEDAGNQAWSDVKTIGGSKALADVIAVAQVVGTVAAFLPPPANAVALVAGGVVMAGHLAQMANRGHFDPAEFAEDSVGVVGNVGAGLRLFKTTKGLGDAAKSGEEMNLLSTLTDGKKAWSTISGTGPARVVSVTVGAAHVAQPVVDAYGTGKDMAEDVAKGDYAQAVVDGGTGLAKSEFEAAGMDRAAAGADGVNEVATAGLAGGSVWDRLAAVGGYEK